MTIPVRALILEDSARDAELLVAELRRVGLEIVWRRVETEAAYLTELDRGADIILADYSLPEFDARRALHVLHHRALDIPFIVVSGSVGEERAVELMREGASDYLFKDRLARLGPAITRALEEKHLLTAKRTTEVALAQRETSFRALFANNPLPMWVYDLETLAFLEVNDSAVRHYGYAREEFLTMTIADIRPAEDVGHLLANVSEVRQTLEHAGTWRHRIKSGQLIDVEIVSHTLTHAGRPAALVVAQDVTERKRLEAQFQQAQKMEAIGQLAGGVAHDFNNLLTAILGYCDLVVEDLAADDPRRADLEEIRKAGLSAASLTAQLLAFSRKQIIEPRVIDLNAVIVEMGQMLQRLVGEEIEIEFHLSSPLDRTRADPGQVHQVLLNLVVNARDAMPRGGKVTIDTANVDLDENYASTRPAVVPGPYVMLAVSDTGVGMTPEVQARLFEPFFTTKGPGKGTGLGLASIYGIVKQSGGHIWIYSEPGHGTTFKVYLPRTEKADVDAVDAEPVPLSGTGTILVVEDSSSLRMLASKILQRYGYSVFPAATADDALRFCREFRGSIHLLLTDVVMPGMSGPALADQLTSQHPEMRVLYMSGYTDEAIVRHGILKEGIAFLQKPFTPDNLARKVLDVLETTG